MYEVEKWKHVFKLDPNKEISDEHLELLCESKSDAIIIGGTDNIDLENVLDLMQRVRRFAIPCVLEISTIESISPGFDLYFIPTVLNSKNAKWINGFHFEALKEYGDFMNWDEIYVEGYCILNKDCKAAIVTEAITDLEEEDILTYATMSEKMFKLPIFYLENSGAFANMDMLKNVKKSAPQSIVFYGGGIVDLNTAKQASEIADCIVVGNIIYENIKKALETVNAVK